MISVRGDIKKIKQSDMKGFSLVELLIALAISAIILAALINYFIQNQKTYSSQELNNEMQDYARSAMDFMAREIRHAGYGIPATDKAVTNTSDESRLEIKKWVDDNENGAVDADEIKTIQYYVNDDKKLIRKIQSGFGPLAENITAVSFKYYDESNVEYPIPPASTVRVSITLTARTAKKDPITGTYKTFTLQSDSAIRNK